MRPDEFKHAHGPYKHGKRWRVVLVRGDGRRMVRSVETRAAALAAIEALHLKTAGSKTIRSAVTEYLAAITAERGLAPPTVERIEYHLESLLALDANGERTLAWLRNRGPELYEDERARHPTADTQLNALSNGRAFGAWCVERKLVAANPFAGVKGTGRRRAGREKPQLRIDEATTLTDYCLGLCRPRAQPEAVAVLAAWLLGTRATELVVRDVRDLDAGGRLLVIPQGKNRNAQRTIEIPEVLRPLLLELAGERGGSEPLFLATDAPTARRKRGTRRATRHWLHYHCGVICEAAGVPSVAPHGLRRSHMTAARAAGATAHLVAEQVGHGSVAVQARSYVAPGTAEAGQRERVLRLVQGGLP